MVQFAKQLEAEAVPEWGAAYCNYKELKKSLNTIKEQAQLQSKSGKERHNGSSGGFYRNLESPRARPSLSFVLTRRRTQQWQQTTFVLVHQRALTDGTQIYDTQLDATAAPTAFETDFFAKLDQELNKVNAFYRRKEAEFVQQAEVLRKQMEALHEMRDKPDQSKGNPSADFTFIGSKDSNSVSQLQDGSKRGNSRGVEVPVAKYKATRFAPSAILMTPQNLQGVPSPVGVTVEPVGGPEKPDLQVTSASNEGSRDNEAALGIPSGTPEARPPNSSAPLKQMVMDIPRTNPRATISALTQMFVDDVRQQLKRASADGKGDESQRKEDPAVSRKEVQYATEMLRTAYVELYRGLGLLKSYGALNVVAFGKIMKKYDKVTGRRAAPVYLEAVQASYCNSSDKVARLMKKVEFIFTTHFTRDDRRGAMRSLRPLRKTASHTVTFFLGLFSGCIIALIVAIATVLQTRDKIQFPSYYFDPIFQVFSMLALILLHLYLYGWNVYLWRRARINYVFIFEFLPGKELRYREVLLVASGLLALLFGGWLAYLGAHIALGSRHSAVYMDIIPIAMVAVFVLLLFLPFNICYYSSRMFFLKCLLHLAMSPLYKVVLSDFFLGDQLTSQVPMLRNMEFFACYYVGGLFTRRDATLCFDNKHYQTLEYVIALLPYYFRFMQCVRRWFDEADRAHIANGLKYLSAMVAVVVRMMYSRNSTYGWLLMVVFTSVVATGYGLYWDLVVDWGLLKRHSKNPWLRDQLMLQSKATYFLSMVANTLLRLAWLLSLNHLQISKNNKHFQDLSVAVLEVLRRGMWNFFRLENEHLNNVGKFRAVKAVPLPFRELVADESDRDK